MVRSFASDKPNADQPRWRSWYDCFISVKNSLFDFKNVLKHSLTTFVFLWLSYCSLFAQTADQIIIKYLNAQLKAKE